MDEKKVTPRSRPGKNQRSSESSPPPAANAPDAATACEALIYKIEDERGRLMSAEAILHCAVIALDEADGDVTSGPDYATLIDLARDLIKQSIDKLDSVRLKATLQSVPKAVPEAPDARDVRDVKEEVPPYIVH